MIVAENKAQLTRSVEKCKDEWKQEQSGNVHVPSDFQQDKDMMSTGGIRCTIAGLKMRSEENKMTGSCLLLEWEARCINV